MLSHGVESWPCDCFLSRSVDHALLSTLDIPLCNTLRTSVSAFSATATTDASKIVANNFEAFQLVALQDAGLMGVQRPFTIVAEAITSMDGASLSEKSTSTMSSDNKEGLLATKIIHFQRHGQRYHNLIGEMFREMLGKSINTDDKDPQRNPFIREETIDSPLTENGRLECVARRTEASLLSPEVVIVSPLHRAIQTSILSFADHIPQVKWIAHEGAREQLGLLMCNKRRVLSATEMEFSNVDFSEMLHIGDEDCLWHPTERANLLTPRPSGSTSF
jgi:hypothetical protein